MVLTKKKYLMYGNIAQEQSLMIPETCNQCLESLTRLANFYPTWQLEILFGAIQLPGNHPSPRFYKAVFQEFQASHL